MIRLEKINPIDLTLEEIEMIVRSCLASFDGATGMQVIEAAELGHVGIHRISGDAQGIIAFEASKFNGRLGLKIVGIAGKGLIPRMQELNDQAKIVARACGAEFIWGIAKSSGLGRVYLRRANAYKAAEVYVEDLI